MPAELAFRFAALTGEVNARMIRRRDMVPYLRGARYVDLNIFLSLVQSMDRHDAWEFLPEIDLPALVIAAEKDTFTPPRLAEQMAERIPGAELMMVRGASHAAPIELPELINLRIEKFLIDRLGDPGAGRHRAAS
jgi:pimeloyl-ACP methyl ester carboxylesterase